MKYAIMLVLILTACAPLQFENAGSQNKFEDDRYDCQVQLGYIGNVGGNRPTDQLSDYLVRGQSSMQRCLERKGWRVVQPKKNAASAASKVGSGATVGQSEWAVAGYFELSSYKQRQNLTPQN